MERIYLFLPSIVVCIGIAAIGVFYTRWATKQAGNNFCESVAFVKKHLAKAFFIYISVVCIFVPVSEELIFRAPLILAFSSMTSSAWYAVLISAVLFALLHERCVFILPLGILAGYYGIKYQSIWLSIGIHAIWNLIMPFIFGDLTFQLDLFEKIKQKRRKMWKSRQSQ